MAHNNEICEECEQDVPTIGYYTRSKRRKLNKSDEECSLERKESTDRKRKNPIMFIPLEILTEILRKISFEELGSTCFLIIFFLKVLWVFLSLRISLNSLK